MDESGTRAVIGISRLSLTSVSAGVWVLKWKDQGLKACLESARISESSGQEVDQACVMSGEYSIGALFCKLRAFRLRDEPEG